MTIKEYIEQIVKDIEIAEGSEVIGTKEVELVIGVAPDKKGGVVVNEHSPSKIKLTLRVKRK